MATSSTRDFDTTTEVDTGENTTFNFTTADFTVGVWLNADTVAAGSRSLIGNGGAGNGWMIRISTATPRFVKPGIVESVTTGMDISIDTWYFLAVAVNNGTELDFFRMDESGTVITDNNAAANNCASTTNTLKIGNRGDGSEDFDGQIAHAQIWNRLLSTAELQEAAFKPGSIKRGLLGYWPVWGSSTTEPDLGPSGFNGTVTGTDTAALDHPRSIIIKGS